ncbi:hypothetical protein FGO68_gene8144 [Halteria grandinella]|uniref:Uncharacterized protein n=1 Tax=Halteria grandinella TaxID=5974 RepID=A0A8J8NBX2_HALGN|nr:hypothetical protein FGO68_gene8144 [Halteria grandinella]
MYNSIFESILCMPSHFYIFGKHALRRIFIQTCGIVYCQLMLNAINLLKITDIQYQKITDSQKYTFHNQYTPKQRLQLQGLICRLKWWIIIKSLTQTQMIDKSIDMNRHQLNKEYI